MHATELELQGLKAIADSDYFAGSGYTGREVLDQLGWTFGYVDQYRKATGRDAQSAGGVLASLVAKGFASLETHEEPQDCIRFTEAGYTALRDAGMID